MILMPLTLKYDSKCHYIQLLNYIFTLLYLALAMYMMILRCSYPINSHNNNTK